MASGAGGYLPGAVVSVAAADERRHRSGAERLWGESWLFDFATPDGSMGGYARLGLYPNLGVAWCWAALVGRARRLVTVCDHDIELPRGADLEVRGQGLWAAVTCETPLDHWSIGLEAFAVAMDDPAEVYRSGWGDRVGLGFDLEWEAAAGAFAPGAAGYYEQSCRVHGEILVGEESLAFDGVGRRSHRWGVDDWWSAARRQASGTLEDGTAFWARDGELDVALGQDGLPFAGTVALATLSLEITPVAHAPLAVDEPGSAPPGRRSRLARSLCRYRAADGRTGAGWLECLQPSGPLES